MPDLAAAFAGIAAAMSAQFGGPYHDAAILTDTGAVFDDGGSIVTPGTVVSRPCQVQIDSATEAMRAADGFADGDVRFLILAATLAGSLDTDARVEVLAGPYVGVWMVSSLERDPAAIGYVGRGRRA